MPHNHELPPESLWNACDPGKFRFQTTAELEPLEGIIGQERAVKAVGFGLRVSQRGYNMFLTGRTGSGKLSYIRSILRETAAGEPVPDDWCYVYNFENPTQPRSLSLPAGLGQSLCQDMKELVEELLTEIPRAFQGEDYESQKGVLLKGFQTRSNALMDELNGMATAQGFTLKRTSTGFITVPVVEGKAIDQEDFDSLDTETRQMLEERSAEVQVKAMEIVRRVQQAERETKESIRVLENKVGLFAVGHLIESLREKYAAHPLVQEYLRAVQEDVLANLDVFRGSEEEEETSSLPWLRRGRQNALRKYRVNLFVDNREHTGAPVVVESNATYYNLVGRIEHENEWGVMTTDFTMLRPGALHRANGGYLVLQVKDVLSKPESWEALKRVLLTGEVRIENMGEHYGLVAMATLKPAPIPVRVKVILIGSPYLYHLLHHHDEDFQKLFKIKADFDVEMPRTLASEQDMARFISSHCRQQGLRHFSGSGVAQVVEYSSRLADHQRKMTTCFNEIVEVLYEANAWAEAGGAALVDGVHVQQAVEEKRRRSNRYEEKLQELFRDGTLLLDVDGQQVGQVNGLAVLDLGDYVFGKPSRITAVTAMGERGVLNIERETRMSGASHSKGVLILSGFLAGRFAQRKPLALSASLTFEQLYEGVDGDSASSTELYALLSSLAELPVDQGLAVTGSVNQKGEIQPVGGVTAKVEGFFEVCRLKGLTGRQGVLIPHQNVLNLNLRPDVVEAVHQGKFHIYPVHTVDEGIEILTGVPAGKRQANGHFPRGTVNHMVERKLRQFARHGAAGDEGKKQEHFRREEDSAGKRRNK